MPFLFYSCVSRYFECSVGLYLDTNRVVLFFIIVILFFARYTFLSLALSFSYYGYFFSKYVEVNGTEHSIK